MISGHCECGRIQYEAKGPINDFSHCHCSQCRRLHGAAYATFAGVPENGFRFTSGNSDIKTYASSAGHDRVFCPECGSSLLATLANDPDNIYLAMGTMDGSPDLPTGYHIFVGSKAPWHEIADGLVQFENDSVE